MKLKYIDCAAAAAWAIIMIIASDMQTRVMSFLLVIYIIRAINESEE